MQQRGIEASKRTLSEKKRSDLDNWCGKRVRVNEIQGCCYYSTPNNSVISCPSGSGDSSNALECFEVFSPVGHMALNTINVTII